MSGVDRVLRLVTVGCLIALILLAHGLADTRDRVREMEDELVTVVADCVERGRCEYVTEVP